LLNICSVSRKYLRALKIVVGLTVKNTFTSVHIITSSLKQLF